MGRERQRLVEAWRKNRGEREREREERKKGKRKRDVRLVKLPLHRKFNVYKTRS